MSVELELGERGMAKPAARLADRPGSMFQIGQAFFGPSRTKEQIDALQEYYRYYIEELQLLQKGISAQSWQGQSLAAQSYEDIFHIVTVLRNNRDCKRPKLRAMLALTLHPTNSQGLNWSINLAIRLWLMINVQDPKFEGLRYEATCVDWDDQTTLRAFIESLFPKSQWKITAQTSRLGSSFTAAFMHRVCGLKIKWTTSIHDHLRLDRRRKTLMVFPYKCHLHASIESRGEDEENMKSIIPLNILKETISSLDLLFPFWDAETVALLKKEKQTFHEYGPFEDIRTLTLVDFETWRDRLLELHEEIFQSPPVSWAQLWRDRRNPQQFWTFWVAMMILLLTVFSTVATIIQAWASVEALTYVS